LILNPRAHCMAINKSREKFWDRIFNKQPQLPSTSFLVYLHGPLHIRRFTNTVCAVQGHRWTFPHFVLEISLLETFTPSVCIYLPFKYVDKIHIVHVLTFSTIEGQYSWFYHHQKLQVNYNLLYRVNGSKMPH
jgi:hypothetical protein